MKTIKKVVLAVALLVSFNSYGQNILTANGDTLATINTEGVVRDAMNQQIGEITTNGEVKNAQGTIVGNIVGDKFNDAQGMLLGEIKIVNGVTQIVMPGDFVFATIVSGNQLVETSGNVLVNSSGTVTPIQLVAYFFYF